MKCSFVISKFLEVISSLPIILFFSISLHWSVSKVFLSLLAILWNSAFRWVYLFFSSLSSACLLLSVICKASSDNYFAFLQFFLLGLVLVTASCTMSETFVHTSSGTLLSDLIPWIYLSLPLFNIKKLTHYFAGKVPSSQCYGCSGSHVWMLELDQKEDWELQNRYFCTMVLEKTL